MPVLLRQLSSLLPVTRKASTPPVDLEPAPTGIVGLRDLGGVLAFDDLAAFDAVAQASVEDSDEALESLPFYSYADAYHDYIVELGQLEELPATFDEALVSELPEESDYWFEKIVSNRFFELISNPSREFVVGDEMYVSELGQVDVYAFDRQAKRRATQPLRSYPVEVTYSASKEVVQRDREQCEYWNPSGRCNDQRLNVKTRTVNAAFFVALEAVTENEREKKRTFSKRCKWVQELADRLRHEGRLFSRFSSLGCSDELFADNPCDQPVGRDYSKTRDNREDITTPVWRRSCFGCLLQDTRGNNLSTVFDGGQNGECEARD